MRGVRDNFKEYKDPPEIHDSHVNSQKNIDRDNLSYYKDEKMYKWLNNLFKRAQFDRNSRLAIPTDWKYWTSIYDGFYHDTNKNVFSNEIDTYNKHDENILWWFVNVFASAMDRVPMPNIVLDAKAVMMDENPDEARRYKIGLQRELVRLYREHMNQYRMQTLIDYGKIGNAFINTTFDFKRKDIKIRRRSALTVYPDPTKHTLKECEDTYCIFYEVMALEEAEEKYGVQLVSEGDYYQLRIQKQETEDAVYDISMDENMGGVGSKSDQDIPAVTVITLYLKDSVLRQYETNDIDEESGETKIMDDGEPHKIKKVREKYPNGRVMVIFPNQENYKNYIIEDYPNQYKGLWVDHLANHQVEYKGIWGSSDGKPIESHIRYVNHAISILPANLERVGLGWWSIVGTGIRTDRMQEDSDDTQIIPPGPGGYVASTTPSSSIKYITPSIVSESIIATIDWRIANAMRILGITNAFEGNVDFAGQSGESSKVLIAQSSNRMSPKLQAWADFNRDLYTKMTHIITRFYPSNDDTALIVTENESYKDEQTLSIGRGKSGESVETEEDKNGDTPNIEDINGLKIDTNKYLAFIPELGKKYRPRIELTKEAIQPIDPNEEINQAMAMAELGMNSEYKKMFIDPEQVAELMTGIENRERVIMYIEEVKRRFNVEEELKLQVEELNDMIESLLKEKEEMTKMLSQAQRTEEEPQGDIKLEPEEIALFDPQIPAEERAVTLEAFAEVNPTRLQEILEAMPELMEDPVTQQVMGGPIG